MYVTYPSRFETFGAVKVYELSRIHTLFAVGAESKPGVYNLPSFRDLENIAESTIFIVPVKDEEPSSLEGVLKAIPHHSPVIIVSASSIHPLNMYKIETDIAKMIHKTTGRTIIVVHQKDKIVADKLKEFIPDIVDSSFLIRDGKGEGLLLGVILADGLRARNVAFVDADNFIPSVVLEYALTYYTVLGLSESKYKMVRIYWSHKAWTTEELYFRRFGRVSVAVNNALNKVISLRRRIETDIFKTSNSGEHAMSIELAKELIYGGGFSVETQELVSIFEKCYIGLDKGVCATLPENVEIYQVESISPHIHSEKGETHVIKMILESISSIYYSQLPDERGRNFLLNILREMGFVGEPEPVPKYRYPDVNSRNILDSIITESTYTISLGL